MPGQTVALSVELFTVTITGSYLLWWGSKAPKPPEMHLHSQQHLSLSGQTWFNISVTHPTLCPSLQLKKEQSTLLHAFLRVARSPLRHSDPLSPWQLAPSCLHSIYSSPVPAPLPAVREPTYFLSIACGEPRDKKASACVLNWCWLMKHI